jgi:hypothetical protein
MSKDIVQVGPLQRGRIRPVKATVLLNVELERYATIQR